jgi:PhzF family phenazine biosynthesis protein
MIRSGELDEATLDEATAALGIDRSAVLASAWIDNGPGWLGLQLATAAEVLAITAGNTPLKIGVVGAHPAGSPFAYEARAFFPGVGATFEDPVTGSLNASAAQWLIESGRFVAPYVVAQGAALGRAGRVHISTDDSGQVWVGGDVVTCIAGTVDL